MTRTELQTALKKLRNKGYKVGRLNATTQELQDRYTAIWNKIAKENEAYEKEVKEVHQQTTLNGQHTELTCDVCHGQGSWLTCDVLDGQPANLPKLTRMLVEGVETKVWVGDHTHVSCGIYNHQKSDIPTTSMLSFNWRYGNAEAAKKLLKPTELSFSDLHATPKTFTTEFSVLPIAPFFPVPTVDMVRNLRISLLALLAVLVDALAVIENNHKAYKQRGIRYAHHIAKQTTTATLDFTRGFLYGLSQDYRDTKAG